MDSLIFMPDSVKGAIVGETAAVNKESLSAAQWDGEKKSKEVIDTEVDVEVEVEKVERPVDLYKAIFSDDSDDEEEKSSHNQVVDPEKKIEVASTALSRLIAGDFLESLGKELGLEVPPDLPKSGNKSMIPAAKGPTDYSKKDDNNSLQDENKSSSALNATSEKVPEGRPYNREITQESGGHKIINTVSSQIMPDKVVQEDRKSRTPTGRRDLSSSSSGDERSRKPSRRHRHRSSKKSDGDTTDSSDDYRDRYRSKSKGRKKESSREKSSNKKHSKHHKHRSGDSPSRSSRHGSEKVRGESKRERRKWND